ncbi:MAG: hypothetical protein WCY26_09800, partial [Thiohalobacteraceae bacterium]
SRIPNPESRIPNPESRIPNPESRIPNPESRIPNPESRIPNPSCRVGTWVYVVAGLVVTAAFVLTVWFAVQMVLRSAGV